MNSEMMLLSKVVAAMLLAAAISGSAYAACSCCAGGSGGEWSSGPDFIGADAEAVSVMEKNSETEEATEEEDEPIAPSSAITPEELAEDRKGAQRLVMAYVGVPGDASFIEGSIHLPLASVFNEDGTLKSPAEIADLFGAAFWVMKYIGHEEVFLLEGTREDREAAGLLFVANPTPRAAEIYIQDPNLDLLASDDDLTGAQLVDARSAAEYDAWHMEGAVNIDSSTLIGPNGRLADDEALSSAFSGLNKDQPVVFISSKGGQASIDWYSLFNTQGHEGSLYFLGSQA